MVVMGVVCGAGGVVVMVVGCSGVVCGAGGVMVIVVGGVVVSVCAVQVVAWW